MWDEEVDDCLWTLNFFSDWFVTKKIIEMFLTACTQMIIYSI